MLSIIMHNITQKDQAHRNSFNCDVREGPIINYVVDKLGEGTVSQMSMIKHKHMNDSCQQRGMGVKILSM